MLIMINLMLNFFYYNNKKIIQIGQLVFCVRVKHTHTAFNYSPYIASFLAIVFPRRLLSKFFLESNEG